MSRSPLRLLGFAIVAMLLMLLALEMTVTRRWYPEPELTEARGVQIAPDGSEVTITTMVRSQKGSAELRRDVILGTLMGAAGLALIVFVLRDLVKPEVFVTADENGLAFPSGDGSLFAVSWNDIREVRSAVHQGDFGTDPVLLITVDESIELPERLRNGIVDGSTVLLHGSAWEVPPWEVAARLDLLWMRHRSIVAGA